MAAFLNPLSSTANTTSRAVPASPQQRNQLDPQLQALLGQKAEEWIRFLLSVTFTREQRAIQQASPIQLSQRPTAPREPAMSSSSAESFESVEMQWLVENSQTLEAYRGEWLLIVGEDLIAHSADFRTIRTVIVDRNIRSPFVYYVPTEQESNFLVV